MGPVPPRVSVIIPAHNAAGVIAETLDSVLAQTFDDFEVIVVDDASQDDTARTAAGYAPRIRFVRSETNLGPAGARNLALAHASGELLALLDADDQWLPDYLTEQVALYDREQRVCPGVGIVGCDAWMLDPTGRRERTWRQHLPSPPRLTLIGMLRMNAIFVSALAPRALVQRLGGFSTDCWGSEDHDLWLRILETGHRAVVNPRPLAIYRVAAGSVSDSALGMARTSQVTYDRALARGNLTFAQRVVARRYRRVQAAVEHWERLRTRASAEGPPFSELVRAAPTLARVVLEHPNRWWRWARVLLATARGAKPASR
jgi:glycosyltransferase involved in cell wall biosynthesis